MISPRGMLLSLHAELDGGKRPPDLSAASKQLEGPSTFIPPFIMIWGF